MNPRPADYESAALPLSYLGSTSFIVAFPAKKCPLEAGSAVRKLRDSVRPQFRGSAAKNQREMGKRSQTIRMAPTTKVRNVFTAYKSAERFGGREWNASVAEAAAAKNSMASKCEMFGIAPERTQPALSPHQSSQPRCGAGDTPFVSRFCRDALLAPRPAFGVPIPSDPVTGHRSPAAGWRSRFHRDQLPTIRRPELQTGRPVGSPTA